MSRLPFTEQLRLIDDANLDPYQFRMLMHFWRVGKCFESLRTTAEKCNMSLGKASEVKQWLMDNGWIEHTATRGKVAVQICSPHEQCSPHEHGRSPHELTQQESVHHMNAILNEPNILNEPLLNDEAESDFPESTPLPTLVRHFTELTTYFPPNDTTPNFENKWKRPLMAILEKAGGIEAALEVITGSVELLIAKKYKILSPYSIQTTAVNILNGADEKKNTPDYRPSWLQVKTEMDKNGRRSKRQWNGEIAPVLKRAGGYVRLCSLSVFDAEQTFKNAYKDTT